MNNPPETPTPEQSAVPSAGSGGSVRDDDNVIARCPYCKRIVFAAANLPHVMDTCMFTEIGKLVKDGYQIEHAGTEAVRKDKWGCKCD